LLLLHIRYLLQGLIGILGALFQCPLFRLCGIHLDTMVCMVAHVAFNREETLAIIA
jgi:hypothetical protein